MHQAKITGGKIVGYQCIVPTTWNGSPKDAAGNRGAMEACMVGIDTGDKVPFSDAGAVFTKQNGSASAAGSVQGGVEVMRIAQSFDPCIACAIH
jgi:hydrogenase large subunit